MTEHKYILRIGEATDDGHNHVHINILGWKCSFDAKAEEYFQLSGIATPERVQRLVDAANGGQPRITASLLKMLAYFYANTSRWELEDIGIIPKGSAGDKQWERFNHNFDIFILKLSDEQCGLLAKFMDSYVSTSVGRVIPDDAESSRADQQREAAE